MSIDFNNKFNNDIAAQKNQDGTTGAGAKNDTDKTLFTRQQFTNSIMNALSGTKLNDSQVSQFKQEATSIFSTYDNSPQDNKWSQTEANNGGTNALSTFFGKVNNAIKQVTSAVNVNKTQDVSNTSEVSKANKANNVQTAQDIEDNQIGEVLQQNVQRFMDENNISQMPNISELNNATTALMNGITKGVATDNNGNEVPYIIDLNTGKISKISASEAQQVDKKIKGVNDKADTLNKVLNLNDILDKYAQKGFQPVGKAEQKTINGQTVLIGTLRNSNGEEVKINLKTGEEIKE